MDRPRKSFPSQNAPRFQKGPRPASGNFLYEIYNMGGRRLNRVSNVELFFLAILGGGFICLGSLLSLLLTMGSTAVQPLLAALGFTLGMLLVLLTNAALVTEANIFIPNNFYRTTIAHGCLKLFRFWGITFVGNIVGAIVFAYFVYLSQEYSDTFRQNLLNLMTVKLSHASNFSYRSMGELILSGMIANWVIALVVFFALASRNLMNQFVITFLVFI
jgi:formate/nitrite transporter FocA (FNT family)